MHESPMREIRYRRVVDLSHSIKPGMPRWPGDPPVRFETVAAITEVGYFLRRFEMGEHSGTHISSPATFYADAAGPDDLQPEQLVVTVAVVDVSVRAGADPDYVLDRREYRILGAGVGPDSSGSVSIAVHRMASILGRTPPVHQC